MVSWLPALTMRLPSVEPTDDATWVTDSVAFSLLLRALL